MQAAFLLVSAAEWCDGSFELYTPEPKSEEYHFLCPACKKEHTFHVLERRSALN